MEYIEFINDTIGFAAGSEYLDSDTTYFLKTTNRGPDWNIYQICDSASFYDIYFVDENVGFVVGCPSLILKTLDGGDNSIRYYPNIANSIFTSVYFVNENVGYIAGKFVKLLPTLNLTISASLMKMLESLSEKNP